MGVFNDEFDGVGGSYIFVDGKRVPVVEKPIDNPPAAPEPQKDEE